MPSQSCSSSQAPSKPLCQVHLPGTQMPSSQGSPLASGGRSRPEGRPRLGKGDKCRDPLTIQRSHQTGGEGPSCAFGSRGGPAQGTRAWAPRSAEQRGRWSLASGEVTWGGHVAKDIPAPGLSQAPASVPCSAALPPPGDVKELHPVFLLQRELPGTRGKGGPEQRLWEQPADSPHSPLESRGSRLEALSSSTRSFCSEAR